MIKKNLSLFSTLIGLMVVAYFRLFLSSLEKKLYIKIKGEKSKSEIYEFFFLYEIKLYSLINHNLKV